MMTMKPSHDDDAASFERYNRIQRIIATGVAMLMLAGLVAIETDHMMMAKWVLVLGSVTLARFML